MKKIDFSLLTELVGVSLVAIGLGMIFVPLSFIVVGGFLVWITEKTN